MLDLPLAKSGIDRDYLARESSELFDELWSDPNTRVLPIFNQKVLLQVHASGQAAPKLALFRIEQVPSAQFRVYLGRTTIESIDLDGNLLPIGSPIVAAALGENSANQLEPDQAAWHNLRRSTQALNDLDAGIFAQGLAITNWHLTHQHCPRCGTPTVIEKGGWSRRCFNDDRQVFPRTDPAIIVAVTDESDRILLGSQGVWEDNRWSVLAGYVEVGESLDQAVRREIAEEAGISVSDIHYRGSQPWPFPYSLMFGFSAKASSAHDLVPDGIEIEKLKWFSREELLAERERILLPGRLSIARALIEDWLGEPL
jgi:NAD+ diphosphatase